MTHEDRGHYAKKHPADREVNKKVAEAVKKRTSNGKISCAEAFKIADDSNVQPAEVGFTIDFLETRIVKCQLGLFGHSPEKSIVKPAKAVSSALEEAIRERLVNGRLSCKAAWDIAEKSGIPKMGVSSACETLEIKINSCQLGSF
ncbi:MAG: hypothetical protein JRD02_03140 [Deltaproteobacteria bacterium]|nr:hypothetical protein [Deltaproteobacteria bacterium]